MAREQVEGKKQGDSEEDQEVLEIHERCLEDADRRAQVLEREKRGLEEQVAKLEKEGVELKARYCVLLLLLLLTLPIQD